MKWLEMQSAPKDGTRILVKDAEGFVYVVVWLNLAEGHGHRAKYMGWGIPESYQDEQGGYQDVDPVVWMPCPT